MWVLQINDLEDALTMIKNSTNEVALSQTARLAESRRLEASNHALQQRVSQLQAQVFFCLCVTALFL